MSDSSLSFLEEVLKKEGTLQFGVDATTHGDEVYLNQKIKDKSLTNRLENIIRNFDNDYFEYYRQYIIEGHSKIYNFRFKKEISLEILHTFNHEDGDLLVDKVQEKIKLILTQAFNCPIDEFDDRYNFNLQLTTKGKFDSKNEYYLETVDMRLDVLDNEKNIEIKKSIFEKIKSETLKISLIHAYAPIEHYYEFVYSLDNWDHSSASQDWTEDIEFETLRKFIK